MMDSIATLFQNIGCPKIFTIIGLIFNTTASIILIIPYIIGKHFVDDDLIIKTNVKTGKYLQKKHLSERKNNLWGLSFMILGFIFQIVGLIK